MKCTSILKFTNNPETYRSENNVMNMEIELNLLHSWIKSRDIEFLVFWSEDRVEFIHGCVPANVFMDIFEKFFGIAEEELSLSF